MSYETILFEVNNGVATLTLNRPDVFNAFNQQQSFDVIDAFEMANEAVRKYSDSFAVNMIYNLIKAQGLTAYNEYCYASKLFMSLKDNPELRMDMRKESMSYIFEYMDEIGKNCKNN